MRNNMTHGRRLLKIAGCLIMLFTVFTAAHAWSQDTGHDEEAVAEAAEHKAPIAGLVAVGAGLAIGLASLATGIAQARIGAAGVGAIAENPKRLGAVIMLVAIPETVAILGFVIAYLILS